MNNIDFLREAIKVAKEYKRNNEMIIGAFIMKEDEVIATEENSVYTLIQTNLFRELKLSKKSLLLYLPLMI